LFGFDFINKETEEGLSSGEIAVSINPLNYELNLLGLCDINLNKAQTEITMGRTECGKWASAWREFLIQCSE
jgi:hypothetical protein